MGEPSCRVRPIAFQPAKADPSASETGTVERMSFATTQRRRAPRRRRLPEEAREEALACARRLLLEQGPRAITLKAVAQDLGMTHTNLLHHFGSAEDLQGALMATMTQDLCAALKEAVGALHAKDTGPQQIQALVDRMFDAFGREGAGRLAAWLAMSGNLAPLAQVEDAVTDLVAAIEEKFARKGVEAHRTVTSAVLLLALCAFGDALVGGTLAEMLHRERAAGRKVTAALLPLLF